MHAFLFVLLPIFTVSGATALSREIRWAIYQDAWISGAKFTRAYLPPAALDKVTVVGSSLPELYKAKFYLSSAGVGMHEVADTEKFDLAAYPDKKNWLLVVGKFKAPAEFTAKSVEGNGFTLIKPQVPVVPGLHIVDLSQPLEGEGVTRDQGLAWAEAFGRWTIGKHVEIEMGKPLPRKLGLELKLHAFQSNVGQPVTVTVGKQKQSFTAPPDVATIKLDFDTDGTQRVIEMTIPNPTSPLQAGLSDDTRPLGIALHELRLRDKEVAIEAK
jgi:phosphoglycerol transferase